MALYTTRDQVAGALTAGYDLGYLYFGGRDSDSGWHRTAAAVRADVAGTWTSSSCATELQFATTAEGSTSSEAMIIDSSGKTLVHQINFGYKAGGSALRSDASFINGGTSGSNLSYYSDEDSYWYQYDGGWQQRMQLNDAGDLVLGDNAKLGWGGTNNWIDGAAANDRVRIYTNTTAIRALFNASGISGVINDTSDEALKKI